MDSLPAEVVRFLNERIDTVPHLEALLIVWASARAWDAHQLSTRIYLNVSSAQRVLLDLQRAGLLKSDDSGRFSFESSSAGAHDLLQQVSHTYQRNIARVATLIHNKASSSAREFARAFDLKKDR
jgi:DNA-binding IclR family transcriptional regulator